MTNINFKKCVCEHGSRFVRAAVCYQQKGNWN